MSTQPHQHHVLVIDDDREVRETVVSADAYLLKPYDGADISRELGRICDVAPSR